MIRVLPFSHSSPFSRSPVPLPDVVYIKETVLLRVRGAANTLTSKLPKITPAKAYPDHNLFTASNAYSLVLSSSTHSAVFTHLRSFPLYP